ncbi:MAG: hypothetical protein IPM08_09975 [Actinomycetales bacterium]|nr:hypothetical protein [Actinomycetales bacterium]
MTVDPRAALAQLVTALERHLEVASSRRDPDDPAVVSAAEALAVAFDDYDEALFVATDVATPLAVYGDIEDDLDTDDDGSGVYAGLDDEEIDFDDADDADDDDAENADDLDDDDADDLDDEDERG